MQRAPHVLFTMRYYAAVVATCTAFAVAHSTVNDSGRLSLQL
eukprot:SAG11_NODE_29606_length_309_cov_0.738095_1_plen_41_part_10